MTVQRARRLAIASRLGLGLLVFAAGIPSLATAATLRNPGALEKGCPFVTTNAAKKNSGFLDINALYGLGQIPLFVDAGTTIRIEGDFPKVRYFSLQSYDGAKVGNLVDSLPDAQIVPTNSVPPKTNISDVPNNTVDYSYKYVINIKYAAPPAPPLLRETNTLYVGPPSDKASPTRVAKLIGYRTYLPNIGADVFGSKPLPKIYVNELNLEQTPDQAKCNRNNGVAQAFRSANPIVVPNKNIRWTPVTKSRSGVTFGNGDAYFLRAGSSSKYGEVVVVRLKQAITPGTVVNPPRPPEVRYWSLCQYHVSTTAVLSCLTDRDVVTQPGGEQIIVLSPIVLRPAMAVASKGYNWMEYGSKPNEILGLRQLLPQPDFQGNFLKAIDQPELPLSVTLGEYAPDITYCDRNTFNAFALQGGQAVMAACKLATAAANGN